MALLYCPGIAADVAVSHVSGIVTGPVSGVVSGIAWYCSTGVVVSGMVWIGYVWSCLVLYDHAWSYLVMYCQVWSCLVMYGIVWPSVACRTSSGVAGSRLDWSGTSVSDYLYICTLLHSNL